MRRTAVIAVVCLVAASTASAQNRHGVWFTAGVGIASAGISDNDADADRGAIATGLLEVGWALTPRVLVGVDLKIVSFDVSGDLVGKLNAYTLAGALTYYPRATSGFFVKGGAGGSFAELQVDFMDTDVPTKAGSGFGFTVGTGYDIHLGRGFSIRPAVDFWYGRIRDLTIAGLPVLSDWSYNVIDASVSIKFH